MRINAMTLTRVTNNLAADDGEVILPPCHGMGWLFESTDVNDHQEAKKICDGCDLTSWCKSEFEAAVRERFGGPYSGPQGTWAGVLYDSRSQPVTRVVTRFCDDCGRPMRTSGGVRRGNEVYHQARGLCQHCYPRRAR